MLSACSLIIGIGIDHGTKCWRDKNLVRHCFWLFIFKIGFKQCSERKLSNLCLKFNSVGYLYNFSDINIRNVWVRGETLLTRFKLGVCSKSLRIISKPKSTQPMQKSFLITLDVLLERLLAASLSWGYPIIALWMENQHFSIFVCGLLTAVTSAPFHFSQVHPRHSHRHSILIHV